MIFKKLISISDYLRDHPFKAFFLVILVLLFFMSSFAYMNNNPRFWYVRMAAQQNISIDSIYKLKKEMEFRQFIVDSILDRNKDKTPELQSGNHQQPE